MSTDLDLLDIQNVQAGAAEGLALLERAKPLPDPQRDARVGRARDDVGWFGPYYLAEYFYDDPAAYHAEVDAAFDKYQLLAPAEPRGHAKTTRTLRRRALQEAATGIAPYILIVRRSDEDRDASVLWLREQFEKNRRIRADFGDLTGGQPWTDSVFVLRNGVKIEGLTMGEPVLGKLWAQHRPSRVYIDDPQTMADVHSDTIRERHKAWLDNEVIPALAADGKLMIRQNTIHEDCLIAHAHRNPMFWSHVYDAILREPARPELWTAWEQLYLADGGADADRHEKADRFYARHEAEMNDGVRLLWPEHNTYRSLMMMKIAIGEIVFSTQFRNRPYTGDKAKWIDFCDEADVPEFARRSEGFDLACSMRATAAKTAKVQIAVDGSRCIYITEAFEGRVGFGEQLYMVTESGHPMLTDRVIESNQYQAVLGETGKAHSLEGGATIVNRPSTLPPELRVMKLWRLAENGKMKFVRGRPAVAELARQLCAYREGHLPDLVSALEIVVAHAIEHDSGSPVATLLGVHT